MSVAYGVTAQGFVTKPTAEIQTEVEEAFRSAFGASVPVNVQGRNGQLISIWVAREAAIWQLAELCYASFDPDQATATALQAICALTGTSILLPTSSVVTETLTGTPTTVVPHASIVATVGTGIPFETDADATIAAAPAWIQNHNYSVLAFRITNGGGIWQVLQAGVSQNTPGAGPTGTGPTFVDGTVIWGFLGPGTGYVDVVAMSQQQGPLEAPSGTLTQIQTPVAGWQGAYNVLDAVLGTNLQSDPSLRVSRQQELGGQGKATVPAIRAALLQVQGVTSVTVLENTTDATNALGMPPHSIEPVVVGGANQDIWNAILNVAGAGVNDYVGNTQGTAVDGQGVTYQVAFTRPTAVPIYVVVNIVVDPTLAPDDSATQTSVKDLVVAWGDQLAAGVGVVSAKISAVLFDGIATTNLPFLPGVTGILDPQTPFIGTAPAPGSAAPIPITPLQQATFDTSRVTVNVTHGTPSTP